MRGLVVEVMQVLMIVPVTYHAEVLVNSPAEPSWITVMSTAAITPTITMVIMPVSPVSFKILVTSSRTKWKKD